MTCKNGHGLVHPFLTKYYGQSVKAHSLNEPLDTVTTKDHFALIEPAIVSGKMKHALRRPTRLIPLGQNVYIGHSLSNAAMA